MAADSRPYINRRRFSQIRAPELKGQFVIFARPSLVVISPLAQNEMMVEEVELRRVVEQYFADLAVEGMALDVHAEAEFLDGLVGVFPKLQEAALAHESLGMQQNL